jgi:hypothetical protein
MMMVTRARVAQKMESVTVREGLSYATDGQIAAIRPEKGLQMASIY